MRDILILAFWILLIYAIVKILGVGITLLLFLLLLVIAGIR